MRIQGEPVEKLFLWGHSASTLNERNRNSIIVFGGFGGLGRHGRRNDSLILETQSGILKDINAKGSPSPRLGHTSTVVGDHIFIIGGRAGPTEILKDVWLLDTVDYTWTLLECSGSVCHPRHRHAAASVGTNIYVYGGLNNDVIYSSMHVLDTKTLQWSEVRIQGLWPSARHSHSLVAYGPQLFLFGGYDGEKALGDLYSFNVETFLWKNEKTIGKAPHPRFSHSMFVYNNYLGIVGGCPLRQEHQEVALLDLVHRVWKHVTIDSVGRELWIRSSTNVVNDDLVIVGGGASCFAFGTKFNPPTKICLRSLTADKTHFKNDHQVSVRCDGMTKKMDGHLSRCLITTLQTNGKPSLLNGPGQGTCQSYYPGNNKLAGDEHNTEPKSMILLLEKRYANVGKDILKRFRWLDFERKVEPSDDRLHVCLPVTHAFLEERATHYAEKSDTLNACHCLQSSTKKGLPINEISIPEALDMLLACGGSLQNDSKPNIRKVPKSPQKLMWDAVCSLVDKKGIPRQLLEQLPTRWERLGDIIVLPATSFRDPVWDSVTDELWPIVAKSLGAHRLALQGRVLSTGTRDSTLEILVGDNGWVTHQENGILYSFDATKCMFSSGNLSEKLRMSRLDCRDEIIVDLFAGIGYFVLPFLIKSKAQLVYACEWNPYAIEALRHNVQANAVADRCIILEGDNRITAPKGVADRVCLGLLPTSEGSWSTAVRALKTEGGILHVHGNVNDIEEQSWSEYVVKTIDNNAKSEGIYWHVSLQHLERVKWYGPHIRHLVADIRCKRLAELI